MFSILTAGYLQLDPSNQRHYLQTYDLTTLRALRDELTVWYNTTPKARIWQFRQWQYQRSVKDALDRINLEIATRI